MEDNRSPKPWSALRFRDRREDSGVSAGRGSFLAKFRRNRTNDEQYTATNYLVQSSNIPQHFAADDVYGEDTAPFDIPTFLNYLDKQDRDNNFYDAPELNDSYGTHYYGDDCPGGHYDDEIVTPAPSKQYYDRDEYYD